MASKENEDSDLHLSRSDDGGAFIASGSSTGRQSQVHPRNPAVIDIGVL